MTRKTETVTRLQAALELPEDDGGIVTAAFETHGDGFIAVISDLGSSASACGVATAKLDAIASDCGAMLTWKWQDADLIVEGHDVSTFTPLARAALAQRVVDAILTTKEERR